MNMQAKLHQFFDIFTCMLLYVIHKVTLFQYKFLKTVFRAVSLNIFDTHVIYESYQVVSRLSLSEICGTKIEQAS